MLDIVNRYRTMECFWAEVISKKLKFLEVLETWWLTKEKIYAEKWLPADITLIKL